MAQQAEDHIRRLKCIIIEAEQAPSVPADPHDEDTLEDTLELEAYEIARLLDEVALEVVPFIVNEQLGGP